MNYLKRSLIIISIFLVLAFLFSMFFPSSIQLERSVKIEHTEKIVNEQLQQFKLHQLLSYSTDNDLEWNIIAMEDGIDVTVKLTIEVGFNPISKFSSFFDKEELSKEFSLKIDSLKAFIEDLPKIHGVNVEKKFIAETLWFLSIRDTVNQREASNIHGKLYAQINQYMDANAIVSDAAPLIVYHLWTEEIVDVEAGIPILDSIEVNDAKIRLNKMLPGNVVTAIHYGPYDRLPETYFGINEWMRKNKVVVTAPPWESYITDPAEEENPEKWQTAIFFPVE